MVYQSSILAFMATLLATTAFAAPQDQPGVPPSNGPGVTCQNSWETVTNDPVVQYWYMTIPKGGCKADRMWNHLNLNGCAPTENKYYDINDKTGVALTFHTSEACDAEKVSHAYRSSSEPPANVACQFNPKEAVSALEGGVTGVAAVFTGIFAAFGGET